MGAELERLHAAHQALSIVNNTEARYEARNKLRRFSGAHATILAMGAERERLRGEREKMAKALLAVYDADPLDVRKWFALCAKEPLEIARRITK